MGGGNSSATSKLLVAIWNKPGYRLIERNPFVIKEKEAAHEEVKAGTLDCEVTEGASKGILIDERNDGDNWDATAKGQ